MNIFKSKSITLLARDFVVNTEAKDYDPYLTIEGDRKGIIAWILKLLGLRDPSVRFELSKNDMVLISRKKDYSYLPTKEVHSYNVSHGKNKFYIVLAVISFIIFLFSFAAGADFDENFWGLLFVGLFFWLYKRSNSLRVSYNTYNNNGAVSLSLKSGNTGMLIDDSHFKQLLEISKYVMSSSSRFY